MALSKPLMDAKEDDQARKSSIKAIITQATCMRLDFPEAIDHVYET